MDHFPPRTHFSDTRGVVHVSLLEQSPQLGVTRALPPAFRLPPVARKMGCNIAAPAAERPLFFTITLHLGDIILGFLVKDNLW